MDLDIDPESAVFRDEVRAWLADNVPRQGLPSMDTAEGFAAHREWEARLAEERLSVVTWPVEYTGREASLLQWLLFEEEYYAAGAPGRVGQNGIFMLAPTLFAHGSTEQRDRILPAMARGEQVWAQAWSEPEAGSDIAALRSSAVRTEGGWLVSGQKTWSSRAAFADRAFGLFRSDPDSERHRGLTYLMIDLRADGVTVRPIPQLDGEPGFAELFFDEVFVPDEDVIGTPGDGWRVAMTTANNERGLSLRSPGRFLASADRLVRLWEACGEPAATASRVADAWIDTRAYQLYTYGTATRLADGEQLGPESSVNKLAWSSVDVALHETALDVLGADGELASPWVEGYLFSLAGPIYGGTDQIQRNTIAERVLGLPREERR
ncbi:MULTISPECIES: acyl-CoA dehydrogenase family protein [Prauserella salsuginis group]|uniref:Alkylation response protein AidB-like acyl-CoA dehydrogenase n=2 Tax=Prauserella salsuginis group TaxID=2893672 RepID=A0A839Y170_9PSEU|nr:MULTISPECIES: acyl-CoA dehydrogenase family protein [Prauserella salsuginis group]MBB3666036.1 alkylation response protein AidB-like acyl-CoA dehydrogenase [Prauserella sediminis]MCR3718928.1 Acyl-CoA dehydrogenase [Prauserella flava]MCR3733498.1 Acyl-CoA dehydrogenase [Prauserella salsuginis]